MCPAVGSLSPKARGPPWNIIGFRNAATRRKRYETGPAWSMPGAVRTTTAKPHDL